MDTELIKQATEFLKIWSRIETRVMPVKFFRQGVNNTHELIYNFSEKCLGREDVL